tara:strand:- start:10444 stop:11373 length:930 start_codon:yes stop_codon:yes gene_type:complete
MNYWLKIAYLLVFSFFIFENNAQMEYCPEMQLLLQKYKQKHYNDSKLYLDTVIKKCPERKDDAYYWHISGFVNLDVFKNVDSRSPISKARDISVNSLIKSIELDKKDKYKEHNNQALKYLASTFYNDALLILQNMDTLNHEEVKIFYQKYKDITELISPGYDFVQKDVDINYGLGMLYKYKYENNEISYTNFLDSSINCLNKALELNPNHFSSIYNLGVIYHNLGVDMILKALDAEDGLEKAIIMQEKQIEYFTKALPFFKKAYAIEQNNEDIVQGIAAVYYSLNDMEKHVEYANKLKDLKKAKNPGNK